MGALAQGYRTKKPDGHEVALERISYDNFSMYPRSRDQVFCNNLTFLLEGIHENRGDDHARGRHSDPGENNHRNRPFGCSGRFAELLPVFGGDRNAL